MLIAVRRLLDRARHPASRADELADLRRRLAGLSREAPTERERELAASMRLLRVELAEALGAVRSCGRCARTMPEPEGRYPGGQCCSVRTGVVFAETELAALHLAGTRSRHLPPAAGDHAGCSFRGPRGCSLEPAHRPTICVRYLCGELRTELARRRDMAAIQALLDRLDDAFVAYAEARKARLDREELAAIHPGLVDDATP